MKILFQVFISLCFYLEYLWSWLCSGFSFAKSYDLACPVDSLQKLRVFTSYSSPGQHRVMFVS